MKKPLVYILVLNFNAPQDTIECVKSLEELSYDNYRILIIDNGSTDDSESQITRAFPNYEFIQTGSNLGYTGGNNLGIRYALSQGADYIFILNNDTVVSPDVLERLLEVFDSLPNVGICGPLYYSYGDNRVICAIAKVNQASKRIDYEHLTTDNGLPKMIETDVISGCALLVKREVFDNVGLFDERYYLYWDEVDFCVRARSKGYKLCLVTDARIWHKVGKLITADTTYYLARNKLLFTDMHFGVGFIVWRDVLRDFVLVLGHCIKRRRPDTWRVVRSYLDGVIDFSHSKFGRR